MHVQLRSIDFRAEALISSNERDWRQYTNLMMSCESGHFRENGEESETRNSLKGEEMGIGS